MLELFSLQATAVDRCGNGEKIESYCKSPFFKLEMQKSTSKQPYIFEIETKLLSPTLYSSYIMLPTFFCKNGILLPKLFWPTVRKKCSSDQEKLWKFEAEGQEFTKILRSLEQFVLDI